MSLTLQLHRKLYRPAALETATEAFGDLASISVLRSDRYFIVTFTEVDPDVEAVLTQEFANYVLAETVESRGTST
jgi:hypothetical protein